MKEVILILSTILLFGISTYTVLSYNKNNAVPVQNSNEANIVSSDGNSSDKTVNKKLTASIKVKATDFKLKDLNGKEVSIPTSFFIDVKGTIISKKIGPMSIDEMKFYINSLNLFFLHKINITILYTFYIIENFVVNK